MSDMINKDFLLFAGKASRLLKEGEPEKALHLCEAGVKRFPFHGQGHFVLGLCYYALKQYDNARDEFERTLFFEPGHTSAMHHLADMARTSGFSGISNDWLLKQALYNPQDEKLIEQLKDLHVYDRFAGTSSFVSEEITETEQTVPRELDLDETATDVDMHEAGPVEDFPPLDLPESMPLGFEDTPQNEDKEDMATFFDEEAAPPTELDPADRFDPLAGEANLDEIPLEDDEEKPKNIDLSSYAKTDTDFSNFMEGYLDEAPMDANASEDPLEQDEWLEVDDLIIEDEQSPPAEIEEIPAGNKNEMDETQHLLEELSSADDEIDFSILSDEKEEPGPDIETIDEKNSLEETPPPVVEKPTEDKSWQGVEPIDVEKFEPAAPVVSREDNEEVTIEKLMKNPNLVTPTFGEILIAQRKFTEARHVFSQLVQREPGNPKFAKKIIFLDKFLQATKA